MKIFTRESLLGLRRACAIVFEYAAINTQETTPENICAKVQTTTRTASTQIYEPSNSCFAYIRVEGNSISYTEVKNECAALNAAVASLGAICMIGQLVDEDTIQSLTTNLLTVHLRQKTGWGKGRQNHRCL
jgi:hypothetical protein